MSRYEAVFFDLDETLLDDETSYVSSVEAVCRTLAASLPGLEPALLLETYRRESQAYWLEVAERVLTGALDGESVRREGWRRTLLACGCNDASLAGAAAAAYSLYRRRSYRLFEDAAAALERLHGRLPLVLITNGSSETQWEKARVLGIDTCFEAVLISGQCGFAKPDARIFRLALDKLGVAPATVLHVGDSLASDVAGAHNAGIGSVWINRRGHRRADNEPQPQQEIASLHELLDILAI